MVSLDSLSRSTFPASPSAISALTRYLQEQFDCCRSAVSMIRFLRCVIPDSRLPTSAREVSADRLSQSRRLAKSLRHDLDHCFETMKTVQRPNSTQVRFASPQRRETAPQHTSSLQRNHYHRKQHRIPAPVARAENQAIHSCRLVYSRSSGTGTLPKHAKTNQNCDEVSR